MNAARPRAAFILVNWNTRDLLLQALLKLEPLRAGLPAEVVVIDNDSSDGSAAEVRSRFPEVRLVENAVNEGFAFAVNQGIHETLAPVVCLLNPDLRLECDVLRECLRLLEENPEAGALGPLLLQAQGEVWAYPDRFPTWRSLVFRDLNPWRRPDRLGGGRPVGPDLVEVDWLAGACLFLRREALLAVGGMDADFFLYKEDVDLCLRLHRAGWSVLRSEHAPLTHLVAQSTRTNRDLDDGRAQVEGLRSSVLYARKHMGRTAAFFLAGLLRLTLLVRMGKAGLGSIRPEGEGARRKLRWMGRAWSELDRPLERASCSVKGADRLPQRSHRVLDAADRNERRSA